MNGPGRKPIEPRRLVGYAFVAGMVVAPFLAIVYGLDVGLGVMVLTLVASAYIGIDSYRTADDTVKPRLRSLIAIVIALAAICFLVLALRTAR
jgi:hypothetical protein